MSISGEEEKADMAGKRAVGKRGEGRGEGRHGIIRLAVFFLAAVLLLASAYAYYAYQPREHPKGQYPFLFRGHPKGAVAFCVRGHPPFTSLFNPIQSKHAAIARTTLMASDKEGKHIWPVMSQIDRQLMNNPQPNNPQSNVIDGPEWMVERHARIYDGLLPIKFNPIKRTLNNPTLGAGMSGVMELVDLEYARRIALNTKTPNYRFRPNDALIDDSELVISHWMIWGSVTISKQTASGLSLVRTINSPAIKEAYDVKMWRFQAYSGCKEFVMFTADNSDFRSIIDKRVWFLSMEDRASISAVDFGRTITTDKKESAGNLATFRFGKEILQKSAGRDSAKEMFQNMDPQPTYYSHAVDKIAVTAPRLGNRPPIFSIAMSNRRLIRKKGDKYENIRDTGYWEIDPHTGEMKIIDLAVESPYKNSVQSNLGSIYDPVHKCLYVILKLRPEGPESDAELQKKCGMEYFLVALMPDSRVVEVYRTDTGKPGGFSIGPDGALWFSQLNWAKKHGLMTGQLFRTDGPLEKPEIVFESNGLICELATEWP